MARANPTSSMSAPDSGMPSPTNTKVGRAPSRAADALVGIPACLAFPLLLMLFTALLAAGTVSPSTSASSAIGFAVLGDDPGPWPQILSAVGFQPQTAAAADIVVLRPGAPAVSQLTERVEQ